MPIPHSIAHKIDSIDNWLPLTAKKTATKKFTRQASNKNFPLELRLFHGHIGIPINIVV